MDDKTHQLLVEILTAQALTMQALTDIEQRLGGRLAGAPPSLVPEGPPSENHPRQK